MQHDQLNRLASFIWGIADDVLRDLYVRGKYRDVILPMTVLRRLDAVLEPTKEAVLDMKATLDAAGIANQDAAAAPGRRAGVLQHLAVHAARPRARASQQQLRADFEAYLDGFSPNVQDILDKFEFRNQIPRLSKADALGALIEKFLDPAINLSPNPVLERRRLGQAPGPRQPRHGHDLRGAGPPVQRGEQRGGRRALDAARRGQAHGQPDLPADRRRRSSPAPTCVYDGACGTGGMLTVAEETLQRARQPSTASRSPSHLYGQEINAETYAICQGRPAAQGRRRGRGQHRRRPGVLHAVQRRLPLARVRLHALQSALRQELEERPGAHGRQGRHQGPALHHRARRRPRVLARHPLQRRPDALPGQHAVAR